MVSAAGGLPPERPAREDPPGPEKDLTRLLRDNRLQLQLLEARIDRLRKDLVRQRRRPKVVSFREEDRDPELTLKITQARLERLRKKLAGQV